jgi:hypothetical protein
MMVAFVHTTSTGLNKIQHLNTCVQTGRKQNCFKRANKNSKITIKTEKFKILQAWFV